MTAPAPHQFERAYRDADYRIFGDEGEFSLHVGDGSAVLDRLLARHGATQAALLTAANPGSVPLAAEENARSQSALGAVVQALGLTALPACNRDPRRQWPEEPALLVLDIALTSARQLAAQFGQNAWLWCERGAPVRLVWTEET